MYKLAHAYKKYSNKSAHPHSLVKVLVLHMEPCLPKECLLNTLVRLRVLIGDFDGCICQLVLLLDTNLNTNKIWAVTRENLFWGFRHSMTETSLPSYKD